MALTRSLLTSLYRYICANRTHRAIFYMGASVRQSNSNRSEPEKTVKRKQQERTTDNKTEPSRRTLETIF